VINEEEVAVFSASMFDEMDGELIRSVLQSELEKLSPLYAVVVDLFYIQELRYEDIVRVTGMPMGTVKARLSRARNMLRDAVLSKLGEQ
jgi:DNA-directed RNA polymerase specialized sigma24 family protein